MVYYKTKIKRMDLPMKPRIFVSSTYYDLKYAREDISNFIKAHDFDPIMFENGDIRYTSGKALDEACYEAMKSADMAILIIGGNYGTAATGEDSESKDSISVTRKEFRSAMSSCLPIYVFIENKVYAEYDVYEMNASSIEDESKEIQFRATKDLNVFRFIKEVKKVGNIPIIEFVKPSEIKEFLGKQWSDMFKTYLNLLKEGGQTKSLDESMNEMKTLISKMEIMVNGIGKKVLTGTDDYASILRQQQILKYCEDIASSFEFGFDEITAVDEKERTKLVTRLLNALKQAEKEQIWGKIMSDSDEDGIEFFNFFENKNLDLQNVTLGFGDVLKEIIEFTSDQKNKKELVKNLIQDRYYKRMIYLA